jgi:hypothetical protein
MKTLFITCFTGLISRNILSTKAFSLLADEPDVRVVILTIVERAPVLGREFGRPNVIVEGIPVPPLRGFDRRLWVMATNLLNTRTRRVQRRAKFARDGNAVDYLVSWTFALLGSLAPVRALFRTILSVSVSTAEFESVFERYRPDLLFATDAYTLSDVKCMVIARRRGLKVVGMVRSWDNVTSKTLLSFVPQCVVVNTELIKEEVMRYGDVPGHSLFITGIPHYDSYRTEGRTPRSQFFAKLNLDPAKKLVLFTPPSDTYLKHDPITPVVLRALESVGAQVLVRKALVGEIDLGSYRLKPAMVIDEPARSPDFTEVHLDPAADRHLADSIFHSDVVITWASTMIIDAAVFGKPIVLVGFDAAPRPYAKSIRQYYDYDHQRRIIEMGGVRLTGSPEELSRVVRAYLENPELDRPLRERLVAAYCGELDGRAGERLGTYLLEKLRIEEKEK